MRLLRRLLGYMRPYLVQMIAGAVLLAVAGALMSGMVAIFKPLVNEVLLARPAAEAAAAADGGSDIRKGIEDWLPIERWTTAWSAWIREEAVVKVPLLLIAVSFVRGVFVYFGQYLTVKVGASVIRDLRNELYQKLIFQSLSFFKTHPTGVVMSRVLSDVQRLQRVTTNVLADLVRVGVMAPAMLVVILWHDWRTSLIALLTMPPIVYPMVRFGQRLRRASHLSQESMAEVASLLTESVSGIKVVQGFAMENFEIGRFRQALGRMLRIDLKAGRAAALSGPVMEQVAALGAAALFFFAGVNIAKGSLDPGNFTVVLVGLGMIFISLRRLNQVNADLQQSMAAAQRVFEMMDTEREIEDLPGARDLPREAREVRFEGVGFAYDDELVLDGVDLVLEKGQVVALVGPSGSGKSTLANLLARFYDPTAGRVTVDGHDLRHGTLASLRALIGLVTQETVLFDDSVRHNITCGRDDVAPDKVEAAARAAQAHGFIAELPEGYETRVGEGGTRLSMGQRQRITIARALFKDPPILILDEATSALDAESESLVQEALETLLEGRCSLVIAHRLATVRQADRIVVLDAGRIVEEGTHDELLERGGLYARLCELQLSQE